MNTAQINESTFGMLNSYNRSTNDLLILIDVVRPLVQTYPKLFQNAIFDLNFNKHTLRFNFISFGQTLAV